MNYGMTIICTDNFGYPTLTEGKTYEARFDRKKLFVTDDAGMSRDFPESCFDMNGYEDLEGLIDDLQNKLDEVEGDIENKEEEIQDLKEEIKGLQDELDELEGQQQDLKDQIDALERRSNNEF